MADVRRCGSDRDVTGFVFFASGGATHDSARRAHVHTPFTMTTWYTLGGDGGSEMVLAPSTGDPNTRASCGRAGAFSALCLRVVARRYRLSAWHQSPTLSSRTNPAGAVAHRALQALGVITQLQFVHHLLRSPQHLLDCSMPFDTVAPEHLCRRRERA